MGLSTYIAEEFSKHPEVLAVLAGSSAHVMHVWLIVRESTRQTRSALYAVQGRLIENFPEEEFDFYVVEQLEGHGVEQMVSGIPVVFSRNV